jgi:hypothetical protein
VKIGYPREENYMTENLPHQEITERLDFIEKMIAEGRHSTQRWAWSFLLWGVAYYVAIAWASLGKGWLAWPVTMIAAAILTGVISSRLRGNQPTTAVGRAISAVWSVMGSVLFTVLMALSVSGRAEEHAFIAFICAMLATANGISSLILRWKMQFACAVVWLAAAVGACFASGLALAVISLATIFFCQIVFGIYGMVLESRRHNRGAVHA